MEGTHRGSIRMPGERQPLFIIHICQVSVTGFLCNFLAAWGQEGTLPPRGSCGSAQTKAGAWPSCDDQSLVLTYSARHHLLSYIAPQGGRDYDRLFHPQVHSTYHLGTMESAGLIVCFATTYHLCWDLSDHMSKAIFRDHAMTLCV